MCNLEAVKLSVIFVFLQENVDTNSHQPVVDVKDGVLFHSVYDHLPSLIPSHEAKDLSVPIAFVALLHMCNERVINCRPLSLLSSIRLSDYHQTIRG